MQCVGGGFALIIDHIFLERQKTDAREYKKRHKDQNDKSAYDSGFYATFEIGL